MPVAPSLRFGTVADRWIARYETLVATDQRRARTLEAQRYYLDRHLRPSLASRRVAAITVDDVARFLGHMRAAGCATKTTANALAERRSRPRRRAGQPDPWHAQITTTLSIYTHLFDDARHAHELKAKMATSAFAALLEPAPDGPRCGRVVALPDCNQAGQLSARERAALRRGT